MDEDKTLLKKLEEVHQKWEEAFYLVNKAIIEAQIVLNEMRKQIESEINEMRNK